MLKIPFLITTMLIYLHLLLLLYLYLLLLLRIQDPQKPLRTMMLGVGFRERDTALDFKQVLNDYVRFVDRMAAADAAAAAAGDHMVSLLMIEYIYIYILHRIALHRTC